MATGGINTDRQNDVYTTLEAEKDPHQYQALTHSKQGQNLHHHAETQVRYTGLNSLNPVYNKSAKYTYPTDHTNPLFVQPSGEGGYYTSVGVGPVDSKPAEYYSDATSTRYTNTRDINRHHNGAFLDSNHKHDNSHNGFGKVQSFGSAKYSKNHGMDEIDLAFGGDTNHQHEGDMYEEIPAYEGRSQSMTSLRSTSSNQPILPDKKVSVFQKPGRRLICLVGVIIAVLVLIAVLVAVGATVSRRGETSSQGGNGQQNEETTKPRPTTTSPTGVSMASPSEGTSTLARSTLADISTASTGSTSHALTTKPRPTTTSPTGVSMASPSEGTSTLAMSTLIDISTASTGSTSHALITTTAATTSTTTTRPPLIPSHTYFTSILVIVDHPRDKARLEGDSVAICCSASGYPPPIFYDWYQGDTLLTDRREYTKLSSSLYLRDLTTVHTGHYSCRASNSHSAVFSDSAWIDVREVQSFCDTTTIAYQVPLPTGCTANGDQFYNQGYCLTEPCRGHSPQDDAHCVDAQQYCCGPASHHTLAIQCQHNTYNVSAVTECGCVPCDKTVHSIVGIAQTLDGSTRYSYGHIYLRNLSTPSNDRFGSTGIFELQLENNARRLVMVTDNVYDFSTFYNQSSHVIHLPNTLTGAHYLSADVRYLIKTTENKQASEEIKKEFNLKNGSPFLNIHMGASQYYIDDRTHFNGEVEVSVTFLGGDDMDAMQAAAGDFTFIGGDGQPRYLMAYGLFVIELVGNGTTVYYSGTIDVNITGRHFTNISETRVWRLGESGYWHVEDSLDQQEGADPYIYNAKLSGLHSATSWFAVARASEWETCYTKARVFRGQTSMGGSQLTGATLQVLLTSEDGSGMVSSTRADTDRHDMNGYCIAHPCHETESFGLYATASYEGYTLNNTDTGNSIANNITVNYMGSLNSGATYSNSKQCSLADIATNRYIAFRQESCEADVDAVSQPLSFGLTDCQPDLYRAWHSAQEQTQQSFKSCHIKVLAPNSVGLAFQAISAVGSTIDTGGVYGLREDCVNPAGVVCLQIKPGGTVNCNNHPDTELTDTPNITLSSVDRSIALSEIDSTLKNKFNIGSEIGDTSFQFSFPGDTYGIYYGIFCATDASPEAARWRSKRYCLSGKERDVDISLNEINQDRFAVRFQ